MKIIITMCKLFFAMAAGIYLEIVYTLKSDAV